MPQPLNLAWLEEHAFTELKLQASDAAPLETGGCLMGYWVKEFTEVVITEVIGPGPEAVHGKWYFFPNASWQSTQIARIYSTSARLITYLGDWHSHPTANSSLSLIDKWTMMRIGQHKSARVKVPLMGIMHSLTDWRLTLYGRKNRGVHNLHLKEKYTCFDIKQYKKADGDKF